LSIHQIYLPTQLIAAIAEHRAAQAAEPEAAHAADLGWWDHRLHDLGHNVASLLLAKGMPLHSVAKLTGHDEATLKSIHHHVVGEIVTPEIQAAADWMEALQATQQARDAAGMTGQGYSNVTSMHRRRDTTA
jgi:hypothetical protein